MKAPVKTEAKVPLKTPQMVEFAELFEVAERGGLKKAHVAKKLNISRQMVTMILAGDRNPSKRTLEDMRGLAAELERARAQGEQIERAGGDEDELQRHIQFLREHDRAGYDALRMTAEALRGRAVKAKETSSAATGPGTPDTAELGGQMVREDLVRGKPGEGEPSAHKSGPSGGAVPGKGRRRVSRGAGPRSKRRET